MNVLVTGGSGSGKSAYAERLAADLSPVRTYLATMSPAGSEALARIRRHRRQRASLGFETIECPSSIAEALETPRIREGVVLLDDLENLVSNALFAPDGSMGDIDAVFSRVDAELARLADVAQHLVVVSCAVGCEGPSPYSSVRSWVRLAGSLACSCATRSDTVIEVCAGIPIIVKGCLT